MTEAVTPIYGGDTMTVRVLIVDDQAPFRLAARAVVDATEGFDVIGEVETGEASLDAVLQLHPDLVLMDVNLPGITGLEATRRILAAGDEAPVVLILSTYEPEELAPQAAEAGAAGFISKSEFAPERLVEAWSQAPHRVA
jgi:DNA-binding NarL/FixJ family response regulator